MKIFRLISLCSFLTVISSCAFFNGDKVELAINSNPPGADIFIEGRSYGVTPAVIKIEPRKYVVTLTKEGYGSAVFNPEVWGTVRTTVGGETTDDGQRCLLDAVGVFFFFNLFSERCADFKEKEHFINIPRTGAAMGNSSSSMIGIGNKPNNVIDYYYGGQEASPQGSAGYPNPYSSQGY
jgi:hypothetical protein